MAEGHSWPGDLFPSFGRLIFLSSLVFSAGLAVAGCLLFFQKSGWADEIPANGFVSLRTFQLSPFTGLVWLPTQGFLVAALSLHGEFLGEQGRCTHRIAGLRRILGPCGTGAVLPG